MVVQHNLQAMNANRMLGVTAKSAASSTEKLSSGYRINRAADDAAGLAISEKMRKQIRGLDRASLNAEDGISCVQTAEGALAEVHDMLQRMNELCVQAANGTNAASDRQAIQNEIDQLVTEIDRVSETTKFNEIYLLKGDEAERGTHKEFTTSYLTTDTLNTSVNADKTEPKNKYNYVGNNNIYFVEKGIEGADENTPMTTNVVKNGDDVTPYLAKSTTTTNASFTAFMNVAIDTDAKAGADLKFDGTTSIVRAKRDIFIYDTENNTMRHLDGGDEMTEYLDDNNNVKSRYKFVAKVSDNRVTTANRGVAFAWDDTTRMVDKSLTKLYDSDGKEVAGIALDKYFENGKYIGGLFTSPEAKIADQVLADDATNPTPDAAHKISAYTTTIGYDVANDLEFDLHVGADSSDRNKINTSIISFSAVGIGISKLKSVDKGGIGIVDVTGANATAAIDTIAEAIQKVSTQRSALGAIQNRLEHTIKNLDNVSENTQAAESQIRDTDMAKEMVKHSNTNVLQQAGQSMLAQANQANQGVLSLLQ